MAGITLVELVIAIVIVGAALGGLVAAFAQANRASADPVVTQQMLAIGDSMMEEILLKPFEPADNEGPNPGRAQFNDVGDFNGYASAGIEDIDGNAVDGLGSYGVNVRVAAVALTGVPSTDALRVTVTVTHGTQQLALTGWRTRPW
ncbi:MAG: type IV pilus modification PilV family protein [Telluria sp.]